MNEHRWILDGGCYIVKVKVPAACQGAAGRARLIRAATVAHGRKVQAARKEVQRRKSPRLDSSAAGRGLAGGAKETWQEWQGEEMVANVKSSCNSVKPHR